MWQEDNAVVRRRSRSSRKVVSKIMEGLCMMKVRAETKTSQQTMANLFGKSVDSIPNAYA